jgi:predicted DNA-binding transcriptional regulator AlpA
MAKQRIDLVVNFDTSSSLEHAMSTNAQHKSQVASDRLTDIMGAAKFFGIDPLLNIAMVCKMTSFSRAHVMRSVAGKTFPKPIAISPGRVAWRASDIRNHIEGLFMSAIQVSPPLPRAASGHRGRTPKPRARIL